MPKVDSEKKKKHNIIKSHFKITSISVGIFGKEKLLQKRPPFIGYNPTVNCIWCFVTIKKWKYLLGFLHDYLPRARAPAMMEY